MSLLPSACRLPLQGYCYVNYSTPAAAAAAQADLNGVEYPVGSGFRLKVMYAEIMTGERQAGSVTRQQQQPGLEGQAGSLIKWGSSGMLKAVDFTPWSV